ncbi:coiled-coil domain-containing protein-domain-containing protein [Gaertneriomyces semiglobifer]|nr:coiled-coil domain-containing protein-domain-containing protein [Gaertneriomyces semiglobifer]
MDEANIAAITESLLANPQFQLRPLHLGDRSLPDETTTRATLERMLARDLGLFLEKWGRYLSKEKLELFRPYEEQYEVRFYLTQLLAPPTPSKAQIRNRRLTYLAQNAASSYFSDASFKEREPALYEEYIGQHIPELERQAAFPDEMTLVQRLYANIDRASYEEEMRREESQAQESYEEFDSESEGDGSDNEGTTRLSNDNHHDSRKMVPVENDEESHEDHEELSPEERETLAEEFRNLMRRRFAEGKDAEFDYNEVDNDPQYDQSDEFQRDQAEAYFDSEEANEFDNRSEERELDY